ncbi:MAG TPA: PPOX class F420-dependent oxidoreductase [Acidimicrobiales bacterium]|nr:PPOX class F420-dependent oxidoreductase [Acidimicrobiales bacterium]
MGSNQRAQIRMTDEEIDEFLRERHPMSMATIGPDGRIQLVAMWYGFLDDDIAFETKAKSQKVLNLRRDPRLTVMVEDGETYDTLRGVELAGVAEIIEDQDELWKIGVSVFERYQGTYSEEMKGFVEVMLRKRVGIRLRAEKVVSWDHRKLTP